jgi:hypothetical protein
MFTCVIELLKELYFCSILWNVYLCNRAAEGAVLLQHSVESSLALSVLLAHQIVSV